MLVQKQNRYSYRRQSVQVCVKTVKSLPNYNKSMLKIPVVICIYTLYNIHPQIHLHGIWYNSMLPRLPKNNTQVSINKNSTLRTP